MVYQLTENEDGRVYAKLVRRSPYSYDSTMFLNLYLTHFSYIFDLAKYSKAYGCSKCDKIWSSRFRMNRH